MNFEAPHSEPRSLVVRRTIRRNELRRIVPLADTTIYELEQRGEFPRRFNLTARCVVWDLGEVEDWMVARRRASDAALIARAPAPNVRQRRSRPVRP
jgi:prophage regulatory protein